MRSASSLCMDGLPNTSARDGIGFLPRHIVERCGKFQMWDESTSMEMAA
jgi:hypothetical protein